MFWDLTLYETMLIIEGAANAAKRSRNEALYLAWHTAYLTAYAPAKASKFVKLDKLIGAAEPRKMTPEQIQATVRSWLSGRRRKNVEPKQ